MAASKSDAPKETKRAIESTHLLASIIFKYFNSNPCTDRENLALSILNNIYIAGGACRDYVIGEPINDVDLKINLLKVQELMLNHLNKYHKSMQQQQDAYHMHCILWKRYLNKFRCDEKKIIIDADFIVNEILLCTSPKLTKEMVEIKKGSSGTYFTMTISTDYIYKGEHLKGAEFDIANFESQKGARVPYVSSTNKDEKDEKELAHSSNAFDISMPNIPDFFQSYVPDLSINSLLLPLSHFRSDFYKVWDIDSFEKSANCADYDCLNDFKQKLLTAPNFEEIVLKQHPHVHWWRLVKFLIRYHHKNWTLPNDNVKIHQKYYQQWLSDADFWAKKDNYEYFTKKQFKNKYGLAKTYQEFEIMLKIIDKTFDCNKKLTSIISNNQKFKQHWVNKGLNKLSVEYPNTIDETQQNKIKQLFKKYGYPVECPV